MIDWKTAGVGNPGVDLGELRKQVAVLYGEDVPKYVLQRRERASDAQADDVPDWDAVAEPNTLTESLQRIGGTSSSAPRSHSCDSWLEHGSVHCHTIRMCLAQLRKTRAKFWRTLGNACSLISSWLNIAE